MSRGYVGVAVGCLVGLLAGLSIQMLRASRAEPEAPAVDVARAADTNDPRRVRLSPELAQRAKLKVESASKQSLSAGLRLVGSVNFDADEVADVGARIEGRVARMFVTVGDQVKAGQALVEIESDEMGGAVAALLSARANLIAAENHERRETELAAQQLSSAPVVERARAESKALRAEMKGAEQRLLAMGFTSEELARLEKREGPTRITLRSPIEGEVIERYAVLGQVVSPTAPVLRIADLNHLWVELDVFERDLGHVSEGDRAEIESETHPNRTFRGVVTYVDATVDLATRTAHVRVDVDNPERLLRPGQFVHARLTHQSVSTAVLAVPRGAVLQVEGEPSIFVVARENEYVARPVELGTSAGDWVEIKRGLVEGDPVVTEGAFVLKSELLR